MLPPSPEPQDALCHEIRQEGIERQQVGAALARRNAVEHEDNRRANSRIQAHGGHLFIICLYFLPERWIFLCLACAFAAPDEERRDEQQQGVGQHASQNGLHVVPPGVDVRRVGHLPHQAQHVLFINELQKPLAAVGLHIGGAVPRRKGQQCRQCHEREPPHRTPQPHAAQQIEQPGAGAGQQHAHRPFCQGRPG